MKFVDEAKVLVKGGDGGRGCVSFRREKYVPRGGPDGGNGGRGGHVIVLGDSNLSTLMDFRYMRHVRAKNGEHGMGKGMHGRAGEDTVIPVPLGTMIYDAVTKELIFDITKEGQQQTVAEGGRGGRGNMTFTSSIRQAPRFAKDGDPGEERTLILELKLMADVGLIGLPNAGKSTFLSVVSNAHPRIADYPFTTLSPVLGVVQSGDAPSFVIADLPGLIEGAHEGRGMGDQFLKHCERTRVYLHLISLSPDEADSPWDRYQKIGNELLSYDVRFREKKHLVLLTKSDLLVPQKIKKSEKEFKKNGVTAIAISSITRQNLDGVLKKVGMLLLTSL